MTRATLLDEPAAAVAASLCLLARDRRGGTTPRHPRRCAWCDWPPAQLAEMVDGFNDLAGFSERKGTYRRHAARVFAGLPPARQAELVRAAQELEPEPMAQRAGPAPDEEEAPPWL